MSLLRLPPEVLKTVFDYVGPSHFQEDASRLAVSKQWFEFAHPAFFQQLTLSQSSLQRFIASDYNKHQALLNYAVKALYVELTWYQPSRTLVDSPDEAGAMGASASATSVDDKSAESWKRDLDDSITQLATVAQQACSLNKLQFRAARSGVPDLFPGCEDYLPLQAMRALLSLDNLRVLILDCTVGFADSPEELEEPGNSDLICPTIGKLLPTLSKLHVRMRRICPEALNIKEDHGGGNITLSNLVINLSITSGTSTITSAVHSKPCAAQNTGLLQLRADMQQEAEALTARMMSPKAVKILTHSLPKFEMQSLDVMTGEVSILDKCAAWDEYGTPVEESEPESELLDDDFNNFLDD